MDGWSKSNQILFKILSCRANVKLYTEQKKKHTLTKSKRYTQYKVTDLNGRIDMCFALI